MINQKLTSNGCLSISLLDVNTDVQEERDKFAYFYIALDYDVRKRIENAFYMALHKRLVVRNHKVLVQKQDGINYIRVHVEDILDNINIIKHLIEPTTKEDN